MASSQSTQPNNPFNNPFSAAIDKRRQEQAQASLDAIREDNAGKGSEISYELNLLFEAGLSDSGTLSEQTDAAKVLSQQLDRILDFVASGLIATPVAPTLTDDKEERLLRDYRNGVVHLDTEKVTNDDGTVTVLDAWKDKNYGKLAAARREKAEAARAAKAPVSPTSDTTTDEPQTPRTKRARATRKSPPVTDTATDKTDSSPSSDDEPDVPPVPAADTTGSSDPDITVPDKDPANAGSDSKDGDTVVGTSDTPQQKSGLLGRAKQAGKAVRDYVAETPKDNSSTKPSRRH